MLKKVFRAKYVCAGCDAQLHLECFAAYHQYKEDQLDYDLVCKKHVVDGQSAGGVSDKGGL